MEPTDFKHLIVLLLIVLQPVPPTTMSSDISLAKIMSPSDVYQLEARQLKPKLYIAQDNHPIKIASLEKVKAGKHGASKITVQGTDILSAQSFWYTYSGGKNVFCCYCQESRPGRGE